MVLTELWIEEDGRAKTMASLTGGGAGAELAEGVLQRFSGRLDSAGRLVVLLRWCHVVREVWPCRDSPELMFRAIPAMAWSGARAKRPESLLG